MKIDLTRQGGEIHVRLKEDLSRAVEGFAEIRKAFAEEPGDLVLDLSQVQRVTSFGLASVIRLKEFARAEGRGFRMVNPSPQVQRILEKTGLQRHFEPESPAAGLAAPEKPEAEGAQEFLQKEEARTREVLDSVEAGMRALRDDRQRLTARILDLEGRVTELQAVAQERDEMARELEQGRAKLVETYAFLEAKDNERRDAAAQAAALETRLAEREKELAGVHERLGILRETEEALAQSRRREEALGREASGLKDLLEDVQERIRGALPVRKGSRTQNQSELAPPRGPFLTPP